jgi:hypothetical protein
LPNVAPLPNYLAHSSWPTPAGATTGPLDFGGALDFDYVMATFTYRRDGVEIFSVPLKGHSQTSLAEAVFAAFSEAGHNFEPRRDSITSHDSFMLDPVDARAYARIQWRMTQVLAQVKAHMFGPQSPLVLWTHGFDLSTLWFVQGMNEAEDPQINFGFSPGTPDVGQPYLYFYAWPLPEGLRETLPELVHWHTSWSNPGGIIRYEDFANAPDPEALVTPVLVDVYRTASVLLVAANS